MTWLRTSRTMASMAASCSAGVRPSAGNRVIRAAITLKLNTFDDTGGIIAALTTSVPEAPHTQRVRSGGFSVSQTGQTRTYSGGTREVYLRQETSVSASPRAAHSSFTARSTSAAPDEASPRGR